MENKKNYFKVEDVSYNSKKTGEQKMFKKITLSLDGFEFELLPKGDIHTLSLFKQAQDKCILKPGLYEIKEYNYGL